MRCAHPFSPGRVKAPTKKAFHFPKGADGKAQAPAESDDKASTKTEAKPAAASKTKAKPAAAPKAKAPGSAPKDAKKAPAAKKAAKAPAAEAAPAKTAKTQAKPDAKIKHAKKEKVVRDSFTMPKSDYAKIAALKEKCQKNGMRVKKSELLRAALVLLDSAPGKLIIETVKAAVPSIRFAAAPNCESLMSTVRVALSPSAAKKHMRRPRERFHRKFPMLSYG